MTYPHPDVARRLQGWIVRRVDVSEDPEMAAAVGVPAVPAAVALSEDGAVLGRLFNFISPEELSRELDRLSGGSARK